MRLILFKFLIYVNLSKNLNLPLDVATKALFTEAIKFFIFCNEYTTSRAEVTRIIQFFSIAINSIAMAMSVILAYKVSIFIFTTVGITFFSQILVYCVLGEMIEREHERIERALWEFPFYELDVGDQKIFLQTLMFARNSRKMDVTFFGHVNFELLKNVMNAGYSYFMFIWNFI